MSYQEEWIASYRKNWDAGYRNGRADAILGIPRWEVPYENPSMPGYWMGYRAGYTDIKTAR